MVVSEGQVYGSEEIYLARHDRRSHQVSQGNASDHYPVHITALTESVVAQILREDILRVFGEDLYNITNKNMVVSHLQKVQALAFLPSKNLEWLAEAFTKQKYQEANQIVFSSQSHQSVERNFYMVTKGSIELHFKK